MDYKINDTVLYGTDGVCRISEITKQKIGNETLEYYILKPIYNENSTIFVPTSNETLLAKMKSIISESEIYSALEISLKSDIEWIDDDAIRKIKYKEIIDSGCISDILCLMRALCHHRETQLKRNKKLHVSDERLLKDTEKILCDVFALVLNINRGNVRAFLEENLGLL